MPGILAVLWSGCLLSRSSNREVSSPFACTQCPVPYPAISLSGAPDRPGRVVDEIRPALLLSGATPNRSTPNQEFAPTRFWGESGTTFMLSGALDRPAAPSKSRRFGSEESPVRRTRGVRSPVWSGPGRSGPVLYPAISLSGAPDRPCRVVDGIRPALLLSVGSDLRRAPSDAPGAFAHRCGPDPAGVPPGTGLRPAVPTLPSRFDRSDITPLSIGKAMGCGFGC